MSISLYMDVHVPLPVTRALRASGADVVTAQDDGTAAIDDKTLLERATSLRRILVTQDQDFLQIAARKSASDEAFVGIVFAPQSLSIGQLVRDLELIALLGEPDEFANRVEYLPF